MNRNLLRRIERLEEAQATRGAFLLAWQDGDQLIPTQVSYPGTAQGQNQPSIPLYRRRVHYARYPSQQKFDLCSAAVKGFSGPIGSGKSKALCHEAIKCAYLNPGVTGLIGGPTYKLLNDSTILELLATLEEHGIPHQWLKSSQTLRLSEPNSTILVRSLENPERLRAMNLGWFGVDELSYCKEAAWVRLEGRLRHPGAPYKRAFAVWTPKGKDWVWRRFVSARKIPGYEVIIARPFENRAVLDAAPAYYEQLKHSYDERFYRQEVLGEYLDMYGGAVYHSFDAQRNVGPTSYDPQLPLIWSLDFNVNPMASIIAQCQEAYGHKRVHVLQEIVLHDSHTAEMCREFFRRTAEWAEHSPGPLAVRIYGDATGGAHSASSGGESNWSIIQKIFASTAEYKASFRYQRRNPSVIDRVNAVNGLMRSFAEAQDHFQNGRLIVDPSCTELLTDLETIAWKTDAHGNTIMELDKSDPRRTHVSDAFGYYCEAAHGFTRTGKTTKQLF